ncbi:NAD(P)/FAD-dependent oxidoreductase [Agromyces sp. CFH 90414]|uniref:NAD(P)/FAD-dependent oxidoreductase n=2 Tax=Agromyces agglutinans TaxID=2662258 RepID=A0A6I2FC28_9MICO|nr:NAD(P)/FAD-dependent oxidoreductase [Agromyces agglutinans]
MRVVLVGYGPVGSRFVDELLPVVRAGLASLTVIGTETADAYNRVLVAEHAVGSVGLDSMTVADRAAAEEAGVDLRTGVSVRRIDRGAHEVVLDTGERVAYDRLVLATGARANTPTLDGIERSRRDLASLERYPAELVASDDRLPQGVTALRDLDDAARVREAVRGRKRVIVLGAGVLGLEIALAAAHAGAQVCVVHHGAHPMPRNLDRGGGGVLRQALRRTGVTVIAHSRAEAIAFRTEADGSRAFDMLVTADGKQLKGDLLVLSCGVTPRAELATLAGLRTSTGVVVDRGLRSWSDPDVFAIGDCAHVVERTEETIGRRDLPGGPSGLIGPGWRQAAWLAARWTDELEGRAAHDHEGRELASIGMAPEADPIVMLKAEHIDVVAVGEVAPEPWDDDPAPGDPGARRVAQWADPEHLRYVKMVTRGGVLSGFVSVGMPRTAAELTLLFERRAELPADRSMLLRFDGPDYDPSEDADAFAPTSTVCWCNAVTVERIEESAACGNDTVECVGRDTRAGTGCGGCKGRIADVLARFAETGGAAASPVG